MTPLELAAMVDRLTPLITRGPWTYLLTPQNQWSFIIDDEGDDVAEVIAVEDVNTGERHHPNAETIALVPALMAENQRIRHELERLRDEQLEVHAQCDPEYAVDQITSINAQLTAQSLTRILEGEHHE